MSKIAVIGSGRLAEELLNTIFEKEIEFENIYVLDLDDKVGERLKTENKTFKVENLDAFNFELVNFVFVLMGSTKVKPYLDKIRSMGICIIDKSGSFVNDYSVPLIVDKVNDSALENMVNNNLVSCPNCISLMLATCLKPLGDIAKISKVFVSTYQSVSGVGEEGLDELFEQTRSIYTNQSIIETKKVFTKQIAFNVIPHIGEFAENGNTAEEESLIFETKRILGFDIDIVATCVRVPIFIGHCLAVSVEFADDVIEAEMRESFGFYENIKLVDYRVNEGYVSPFETIAQEDIYVSRLRLNNPNTLSMWIVADNMKAGIIVNMLNIYEKLKFLV